jgi:hypothetical protein
MAKCEFRPQYYSSSSSSSSAYLPIGATAAASVARVEFKDAKICLPDINGPISAMSTSSSAASGSGESDGFQLRHKMLELQRLIGTRQVELQKLTRFPHAGNSAKIAALKEEIARETRELQVLQRGLIADQR